MSETLKGRIKLTIFFIGMFLFMWGLLSLQHCHCEKQQEMTYDECIEEMNEEF